MTVQRMDNVGIVVEDLDAVEAFFVALGLEVEGTTSVEGPWVDETVGLSDVRCDILMMRTPDGHSRLEISRFRNPPARPPSPAPAPVNTLGYLRVMFAVTDLDDVVARLQRDHDAELVGSIARFEDTYRLCYLRGPEGLLIGLAEELGGSNG